MTFVSSPGLEAQNVRPTLKNLLDSQVGICLGKSSPGAFYGEDRIYEGTIHVLASISASP
jgi:hypothetical protein